MKKLALFLLLISLQSCGEQGYVDPVTDRLFRQCKRLDSAIVSKIASHDSVAVRDLRIERDRTEQQLQERLKKL